MKLTNSLREQILIKVMADTKEIDCLEKACAVVKKLVVAAAPKVIRDAYKFDPSVFRHETVYLKNSRISYPNLFDGADKIASGNADAITFVLEHEAQRACRKEARATVEALLSVCSTTEIFIKAAPELEKYVPVKNSTPNLPSTTGLIDKLAAAGWPKGGRK